MIWEIAVAQQLSAFCAACGFGGLLCLGYDILRALRKQGFGGFWAVFFGDLIYCLSAAILTFLFLMIFTGGQVRLFVIIGIGCGFVFCRVVISHIWVWLLRKGIALLRKIQSKISMLFARGWSAFFGLTDKIRHFVKKICKKALGKQKNS